MTTLESLAAKWEAEAASSASEAENYEAAGDEENRATFRAEALMLTACAAELRSALAEGGWQPYVPGETVVEFGALYAIVNRRGNVVAAAGGLWSDPPQMLFRVPEPPR